MSAGLIDLLREGKPPMTLLPPRPRIARNGWLAATALLPIACASRTSDSPPTQVARATASPRLILSPNPISFGTLKLGQSAQVVVTIRNAGNVEVDVARVESSCPCVRAALSAAKIGPSETIRMLVAFDPAEDPDFSGGLLVTLNGETRRGNIAFSTSVNLDVGLKVGTPPADDPESVLAPPGEPRP